MILLAKKLLQRAVKKCYKKDSWLIINNMEQASVARIFYYMQEIINKENKFKEFRLLHLDCEYGKLHNGVKSTYHFPTTRPDIILHSRGNREHNIIIVEFKSQEGTEENYSDGNTRDSVKLKDFTCSNGDYAYKLGVFVKLNHDEAEYTYFQNGNQVEEPTANLISGNTNE